MTVELWSHDRFFWCAEGRWRQLLDVAQAHGWDPVGTTPAPSWSELQDLTSGALGTDARHREAPNAPALTDYARELFAAHWRATHVRRGYGTPPYPKANYVSASDAAALADALERGLPEAERHGCGLPRFEGLSVWFVEQAIEFVRGGGFAFRASD